MATLYLEGPDYVVAEFLTDFLTDRKTIGRYNEIKWKVVCRDAKANQGAGRQTCKRPRDASCQAPETTSGAASTTEGPGTTSEAPTTTSHGAEGQ